MKDCIFCKIGAGKIPAEFIYQDDLIMVFPDMNPLAPLHWLVVPKQHIPEFIFLEDKDLQNKLFEIIQKLIKKASLKDKGYKITINGGGLQEVDHLHIHLTGQLRAAK